MRGAWGKAALAAGLAIGSIAGAAHAEETVSTAPKLSLETQLKQQQDKIDSQDAKIEALTQQLQEVTAILSTRADRAEAATDSGKVVLTNPGPRLEGPNQRNSMNFIGAVQVTASAVQQDKATGSTAVDAHSGTEIKRARLGVQGVAFSDYAYAVELDFAANGTVSTGARDLWLQYNGFRPFAITVGNMKPQNGLEASFSDRSNAQTFVESSMLTSMYTAPGTRYAGARVSTGGPNWSTSVGIFGDDVNNNGLAAASAGGEGWGGHGRFTFAPIASATDTLHFGVSGYRRKVQKDTSNISQLRFRAFPDVTVDANARFLDTNNIANADLINLVALETAGQHGRIGYQAEAGQMNIERIGGRPDLTFDGAYVGLNWFLTGESRVYDGRTGVFTRFSPRVMVDPANGTWGAWELTGRWDTLDLNDGSGVNAVRGGKETNYTAGVNWYWNPYFRMMLNYVHADAEKRPIAGGNGDTTADQVALRIQQEW